MVCHKLYQKIKTELQHVKIHIKDIRKRNVCMMLSKTVSEKKKNATQFKKVLKKLLT